MNEKNGGINDFSANMLNEIKNMVDSNTMLGEPVTSADGTVAIPVSKITVGFGTGGVDFKNKKIDPENPNNMGGGGAGGYRITPVGFLIMSPTGGVSLLQLADRNASLDRAINMLPGLIQKVTDLVNDKIDDKKEKKAQNRENQDMERAAAQKKYQDINPYVDEEKENINRQNTPDIMVQYENISIDDIDDIIEKNSGIDIGNIEENDIDDNINN